MLIPSPLILLNLWLLLKAKRAHPLYQSYWRWSRSEFLLVPYLTMLSSAQHLPLLPLRTLDEQQAAKPSAPVSDPSSVATNLTYLDSPRKVNGSVMSTRSSSFVAGMKLLKSNTILLSDYLVFYSWLNIVFLGSIKGLLLLFLAFYFQFPPFLCCVPAADLSVFSPGLCFSCMLAGWWLLFGIYS